jgi:hypothetical protein
MSPAALCIGTFADGLPCGWVVIASGTAHIVVVLLFLFSSVRAVLMIVVVQIM